MSVIEASKGCTNKDLSRLTDQIIALCENINKIDGETMVINTKEINEKLKNPSEF